MIAKFDVWVGKTLFIPLIIKLCQTLGVTQYLVANVAWMGATASLMYALTTDGNDSWFHYTLIAALAVIMVVTFAAIGHDLNRESVPAHRFWRYLAFVYLAMDVLFLALLGKADFATLFWLLMLVHDYASSIDTIPPKEIKEPERKLAKARADR